MADSAVELGELHEKQSIAFMSPATEILYGGAAGGGKSHLFRSVAIMWCAAIPGLQVYLFRRIREDLIKNHIEGPHGFRVLLTPWINAGFCSMVEDEIRFWNGAKIYLCHAKDPAHVYKYLGAEMHVLLIDELTQWLEEMYRFLRSRVRSPGLIVPPEYAGQFPRILCGSNPGNIGHQWVKQSWITGKVPLEINRMEPKEGGMLRQFIPARLEDNPSLYLDDPDYENKLLGMGSEAYVRAMRHGDWDIVAGAFFDNWRADLHVLPRWTPPKHWTRFRSMDWGSYRPFSIGWWAIADDDEWVGSQLIPRGAIVRYREWYGCEPDKPNTGLKLDCEDVAAGIMKRELDAGESVDGQLSVCDPSMWKEDGGPSLYERMLNHRPKWWKSGMPTFVAQPADNTRIGGWLQMRNRLNGNGEAPMIFATADCLDSIRTIPVLQHDKNRPEDVDSGGEDHAADDWRYGCMARPMSRVVHRKPEGAKPWSLDWIIQQDEAAKKRRR